MNMTIININVYLFHILLRLTVYCMHYMLQFPTYTYIILTLSNGKAETRWADRLLFSYHWDIITAPELP